MPPGLGREVLGTKITPWASHGPIFRVHADLRQRHEDEIATSQKTNRNLINLAK